MVKAYPISEPALPAHFSLISSQSGDAHDEVAHQRLRGSLQIHGFSPKNVILVHGGKKERGFLVPHEGTPHHQKNIESLALIFNQPSVLHHSQGVNWLHTKEGVRWSGHGVKHSEEFNDHYTLLPEGHKVRFDVAPPLHKSEAVEPHYYGKIEGVHVYQGRNEAHKELLGEHLTSPSDEDFKTALAKVKMQKVPMIVIHGAPPTGLLANASELTGVHMPGKARESVRVEAGFHKSESAGPATSVEAEKKRQETARMWKLIGKYHPDKPEQPKEEEEGEKTEKSEGKDTDYFYHGTPRKNLASIRQSGIVSNYRRRNDWEPPAGYADEDFEDSDHGKEHLIYLDSKPGNWGGKNSAQLRVKKEHLQDHDINEDTLRPGEHYATGGENEISIPPEHLEIHNPKTNQWGPLLSAKKKLGKAEPKHFEIDDAAKSRQLIAHRDTYGMEAGMSYSKPKLMDIRMPVATEKHDPVRVADIKAKMEAGHAFAPILLDADHGVIDGHHRLQAAKEAGHTHIPCTYHYNRDEDGKPWEDEVQEPEGLEKAIFQKDGQTATNTQHTAQVEAALPAGILAWGAKHLASLPKDSLEQIPVKGHTLHVRKLDADLYSGWLTNAEGAQVDAFDRVPLPEVLAHLRSKLELYGEDTNMDEEVASKVAELQTKIKEMSEGGDAPDIGEKIKTLRNMIREKLGELEEPKPEKVEIPGRDLIEGMENPETHCGDCGSVVNQCSCYANLPKPEITFDMAAKKLVILFKSEWSDEDKASFITDYKRRVGRILKSKVAQ